MPQVPRQVEQLIPYIPPIVRINPWVSRAIQAYQFYNSGALGGLAAGGAQGGGGGFGFFPQGVNSNSLVWYNYQKTSSCGGSGGPVTTIAGWPSCANSYQVNPQSPGYMGPGASPIYAWGPPDPAKLGQGTFPYFLPGFRLDKLAVPYTRIGFNSGTRPDPFRSQRARDTHGPLPAPFSRPDPFGPPRPFPEPIPRPVIPYLGTGPGTQREAGYDVDIPVGRDPYRPTVDPDPWHPPRPGEDPHTYKPPGPRTKERKVRVNSKFMWLLRRAHDATELNDLIDNLFEALPKDLQKQVDKSGITKKGAFIGEGKKYATPADKLRLLYEHWDKVDMVKAVRNVAINEIKDRLDGGVHGGADRFSQRRLGGSRFVQGGGSASAIVDKIIKRILAESGLTE